MIQYKLLKSELTGDVYPQQALSRTFKTDGMKKLITARYGAIGAAVVDDVVRIIGDRLADGDTVSLESLGTFSIRLGMNKTGVKDFDEVGPRDIAFNGIRFNAAKTLRSRVAEQGVHLIKGEKARRQVTADDRWAMLYGHILELHARYKTPFDEITVGVSDYRYITGCTDYTARKELAAFCLGGKLREIPARRYKIYVLAKALMRG